MSTFERWQQAQQAEGEYWSGLTKHEGGMRQVVDDNRQIATHVES
jgi:hypothetical protein